MTETKIPPRAGIKRVPRPAVIDPNQRYTLAETQPCSDSLTSKRFETSNVAFCKPSKTGGVDTFWAVN